MLRCNDLIGGYTVLYPALQRGSDVALRIPARNTPLPIP